MSNLEQLAAEYREAYQAAKDAGDRMEKLRGDYNAAAEQARADWEDARNKVREASIAFMGEVGAPEWDRRDLW